MMSTQQKLISVVKDFSKYPFGRYPKHGEYSGERFRDEFLIPALKSAERIEVNLDGVRAYGSSFLEEAFGGLVRRTGMSLEEFDRRVSIVSDEDETRIAEIRDYVQRAASSRH